MNREYAATLLDPATSANLIAAMKAAGKTEEEIVAAVSEACRMAAKALREVELLEDDGR